MVAPSKTRSSTSRRSSGTQSFQSLLDDLSPLRYAVPCIPSLDRHGHLITILIETSSQVFLSFRDERLLMIELGFTDLAHNERPEQSLFFSLHVPQLALRLSHFLLQLPIIHSPERFDPGDDDFRLLEHPHDGLFVQNPDFLCKQDFLCKAAGGELGGVPGACGASQE